MSNTYEKIPHEMRFYKQWVTWRYEEQDGGKKPTKVLYNPNFNGHASVDKPDTWVSYDEAVNACANNPDAWAGIGFVLTENDPYCFIDLDDTTGMAGHAELFERQDVVYKMFTSYAEWSPSGKGLHIITKGSVERGRKRAQIEVYSQLRFMTMTGNVYRDAPIVEEDTAVKALWHAMGGAAAIHAREANYQPMTAEDSVITHRMFSAENGGKAREIFEGHWQQHCGSWSEADQALMNIIVFYTKNKEQIIRIFQSSQLGTRRKAYRVDYLERTISLAFDRELPPIDTEALFIGMENARAEAAQKNAPAPEGPNAGANIDTASNEPGRLRDATDATPIAIASGPVNPSIPMPPGLIGDIADFVYRSAHRPVSDAALVAALGLVAGIAGRAFNISGTGLNQYFLFLAPTGTGKEAISSGLSKLTHAVANGGSPRIRDFIGPGQIKSETGLDNWIKRQPSIVSLVGEFGMTLKQMTGDKAPAHLIGVRKAMLALYTKSGNGQVYYGSAFADKEKTTDPIDSPCFSIIGESTQERFYETIDEGMIHEGLLPRFTFFEWEGGLPTFNEDAGTVQPSKELIERVGKLVSLVKSNSDANHGPILVGQTPEALKLTREFRDYCDSFQKGTNVNEITRGIWTRAHLRALKLAATVAIGINMELPIVDIHTARWACQIVADDCLRLNTRFAEGAVGETVRTDENAQHAALVRVLASWLRDRNPIARKYGLSNEMQFHGVVTQSALVRRLVADSAFKRQYGANGIGVKEAIKMMLGNDELRQMPTDNVVSQFGSTAICYMVTNPAEMFGKV